MRVQQHSTHLHQNRQESQKYLNIVIMYYAENCKNNGATQWRNYFTTPYA